MKQNRKETIFISCDVEADGVIPPYSSMLSFGAAAFNKAGELVGTFTANLETLPNAVPSKETMEWWAQNQEAYDATRTNLRDPKEAMTDFVNWVESLNCKPIMVAYPALYDGMWLYHYMMHFVGQSPFSFSALDLKSYVSGMLKIDYRDATKKNMPKRWFPEEKHTHIALDDSIEQGKLFMNILKENLK